MSHSRASRIVPAGPRAAYAAFLDPDALLAWLPPGDMRGRLHAFAPEVGGGYELSLYYPAQGGHVPGKTSAHEDRVAVRFLELVPGSRIVEAARFVSPEAAFAGDMRIVVTFEPVGDGTRVTMEFTALPPGLEPEANDAGARQSLEQLARYLEAASDRSALRDLSGQGHG